MVFFFNNVMFIEKCAAILKNSNLKLVRESGHYICSQTLPHLPNWTTSMVYKHLIVSTILRKLIYGPLST